MIANLNDPSKTPDGDRHPVFAHQPWMVGIVLVFAVFAIIAGLRDAIWFFLGAPFILVLVLYLYVRFATRNRKVK
jgi:hypothetical protein